MRPFQTADTEKTGETKETYHFKYESYDGIFSRRIFLPLLSAFGLSILILGVSAGISQLFFKTLNTALVILGITTLGIALSFIPRVKQIEKSFQGGIYLILVFCLVFASMADLSMFSLESIPCFCIFYWPYPEHCCCTVYSPGSSGWMWITS
jgi:hypothetical protein